MTEQKKLDLETQEIEAAINRKEQDILGVVFQRLEQRSKTGHPINLNATQVKYLWQRIRQTAAYVEHLEKFVKELQGTNKVLADMVQDLQPKLKRRYRSATLPQSSRTR